MSEAAAGAVIALLLWATLAGVDLVTGPQAMLSRPLVAAGVAGWILGDPEAGLRVGVVLELFALDVLAVGAVRYPDYGAAAVGAAAISAHAPWEMSLGVSAGAGLIVATVGELSLRTLRRLNADAVARGGAALRAGDSGAIRRIHFTAMARDAARSLALALLALGLAWIVLRYVRLSRATATALTLAMTGAAIAAAAGGAVRMAGTGPRRRWLAVGALAGTGAAALGWVLA